MPSGVIGGFSEFLHWEIPDFFSLLEDAEYIESPTFALAGCTWHLEVYPKRPHSLGLEFAPSFYLILDYPKITAKTVTFTFGQITDDGSLEETPSFSRFIFEEAQQWRRLIGFWRRDDLYERRSELVPEGKLTVTLRMEVEARTAEAVVPNPQEVESQQRMLVDLESLSSDFKDLFINERKCDVTVNVQGKDFNAHRAVLSARSSVFRAMYEHDTAEEETGALRIPDCDPGTFGEFLNYLYTGKTEEMSFETAYHLYTTADKYDVQRLKSFCADYLKQNLTSENVCEVVILADRHSDDELMSSSQVFFNNNYCKIFLTSGWKALSSSCLRLSNNLLETMAASNLRNP